MKKLINERQKEWVSSEVNEWGEWTLTLTHWKKIKVSCPTLRQAKEWLQPAPRCSLRVLWVGSLGTRYPGPDQGLPRPQLRWQWPWPPLEAWPESSLPAGSSDCWHHSLPHDYRIKIPFPSHCQPEVTLSSRRQPWVLTPRSLPSPPSNFQEGTVSAHALNTLRCTLTGG